VLEGQWMKSDEKFDDADEEWLWLLILDHISISQASIEACWISSINRELQTVNGSAQSLSSLKTTDSFWY
jgi:hypothetical protein